MKLPAILPLLVALLVTQPAVSGDLPKVSGVPAQPLVAQAKRIADALEIIGRPLDDDQKAALDRAYALADESEASLAIQEVLDPLCLAGVNINPESRVKSQQGPAEPSLMQQGWRGFLIKVHNEAGVTAPLRVASPNAAPIYTRSTASPSPEPTIPPRVDPRPLTRSRHV